MVEKLSKEVEVQPASVAVEDFEATPRELGKRKDFILGFFMVILSIFQLYTSWVGPYPDLIQRGIHLMFVLPAAFVMYPFFHKGPRRNEIPFFDWILVIMGIVSTMWITFNYERISLNPGYSIPIDMVFGTCLIIVILESTRRILGWALPIIFLCLVVYALFGPYFPGSWSHRGFSVGMVIQTLYLEPDGIFGYVVGISASIIAGFLIFGVILSETGGGDTFIDLAKKLAGRSHGGPAKVSCFSSAFFGTISGSAVANVVVDGVFNIPLMKGLGYKKEFAAGVEATTSAGGQLMPPMMGAGAFIMAELLGVPYTKIAFAAVIPALLYYVGCYMGIHFWAQQFKMKPLPLELIPSFRSILPRSGAFFIPVTALVYFLAIGRNPSLSVFYTIMLAFAVYLVWPNASQNLATRVKNIIKSLDKGGRMIVMVACLCCCAQMVIGMLTTTGLGIKISEVVVGLSGNNALLCLFFSMIVAIILGMGIPTTAAYVLAASVCVPPLLNVGVLPLTAHMFVFYFAILSVITPPVCAAVFVAAAIAQANWLKAGSFAVRLGLAGFIVPYLFYFAPAILLKGTIPEIIEYSITAFIGLVFLSAGIMGFLRRPLSILERGILILCGLASVGVNMYLEILALLIGGYMYFSQRWGSSLWKRTKQAKVEVEKR